jgi:YD repeat-containing protein
LSGNRRRTTVDYSNAKYAQFGLPYFITEYAADGVTELRRSYRDYHLPQNYLNQRIIGLVSAVHLTDASGYQVKMTYGYDDSTRLSSQATAATSHDQSYNSTFSVRGNVTSVSRWDVTNMSTIVDPSKALTTFVNYNAAGSVISTTDPAGHANSISYVDSFSDGNNSRNTFAYPTTVSDADGFSSTAEYNFDFAAKTRVQGPPPAGQSEGVIQLFTYDAATRLQQITTQNNGAYTRYVYGPLYVQSYSTVNTVADEAYSVQVFDGVGRVFGTATNHPGSAGGYALVVTHYDQMGRPFEQSNPFEVNNSWIPAGDDATAVYYTQQTYDWKGRTVRTTHPDGYYQEASYSGCGCAGGEVVTLTDEVGRQQKLYSDVLGRQWKSEVLNWNGSIYSTATNMFNGRDQVTLFRQWAGAENGGGTYQDTTMSYDGYGRLQTKHVPQQNAGTATVYAYNPDDTIQSVTDARGASATYIYNNNRHLVNEIHYSAPSGITATPNVTYGYDAAGNRTLMSDGSGATTYAYDQLSRMSSETRSFTALAGSYTISYGYNLAGELTSLTEPNQFGTSVSYAYDSAGRLSTVTGSGMQVSSLMSSLQYRASGALKHAAYGDGTQLNMSYNSRMLMTRYELNVANGGASVTMGSQNQFHDDGRVRYAQDLNDSKFDRGYEYDHVGRLKEATSGREARGEPPSNPTTDSPYKQTFSYDAWSNMGRSGRHWTQPQADNPTYANNRRSDWTYDASGNVVVTLPYKANDYDAAGLHVNMYEEIWDGPWNNWVFHQNTISQTYDGNGRPAKRVETRHREDINNNITHEVKTVYQLRSTVLGGATISDIYDSGDRETHVYAGGAKLAEFSTSVPMTFRHANPANGNWINVTTTGFGSRTEFDPLGASVGTFSPYTPYSVYSYSDLVGNDFLYSELGNPFNLGSGCGTLDGMPVSCSELNQRMESGSVAAEVTFSSGRRQQLPLSSAGAGVFSLWLANPDGKKLDPAVDDVGIIRVNHDADDLAGHYDYFSFTFGQRRRGGQPRRQPQRPLGGKPSGAPAELNSLGVDEAFSPIRCQHLRELLNREAQYGTSEAARMSMSIRGGDALSGLSNGPGTVTVHDRPIDQDWLVTLKAFAHGRGFEAAAAVYVAGKRANQLGNRFPGGKRVSPPWQEQGERIAVELAGGSATFNSIFDEEYMRKVCPGY